MWSTNPRQDIFSLIFGYPLSEGDRGSTILKTPRFDMYEEKGSLVIRLELPGFKEDDVEISLEGNVLRIVARKKEEEQSKGRRYFVQQIVQSAFTKEVELPYEVDRDRAEAYFEDGYLIIKLPKLKDVKKINNIIKIRKK